MTGREFIRGKRLEQGLSLRALSVRVGVSYAQIKNIEDGVNQPAYETVLKLLDGLGVSMYVFLRATGYKKPSAWRERVGIEPTLPLSQRQHWI